MSLFKVDQDIQDPNTLLRPEEVLVVSLKEPSLALHSVLNDKIYPNPPGIYVHGRLMPVITPNQTLFTLSDGKQITYEDLPNINDDICDFEGKVLIKREIMLNKGRLLSYGGFYPIGALQLLKAAVNRYLQTFARFAVPFSNEHSAVRYLKPEYQHLLAEGFFDTYINGIITEIHEFVIQDLWRMYFTKVKGDDLYIEKTVDYRIYDWTRMQYEQLHSNDEN